MESNQGSRGKHSRAAKIASLTGLYLYSIRMTRVIEIESLRMKRAPSRKDTLQIARVKGNTRRWMLCIGSTWQWTKCICSVHIALIMSYGQDGGSWSVSEVSNIVLVNLLVIALY